MYVLRYSDINILYQLSFRATDTINYNITANKEMLIDPYDPVVQYSFFFGIHTLGTCTLDHPHVIPLLDHQFLRISRIDPQNL